MVSPRGCHRLVIFTWGLTAALLTGCHEQTRPHAHPHPQAPLTATVEVDWPAAGAAEVETLVTAPIETALNGIAGVRTVESVSRAGESLVTLTFDAGADDATVLRDAAARIDRLSEVLPQDAGRPRLRRGPAEPFPAQWLVLTGDASPLGLSAAASGVRSRIQRIPGVEDVLLVGHSESVTELLLDHEKLQQHGLAIPDVLRPLRQAAVESAPSRLEGPARELANVVVASRGGMPVRVQDVGVVQSAATSARLCRYRERPAVALGVVPRDDQVGPVTDAVRANLPQWQSTVPEGLGLELAVDLTRRSDDGSDRVVLVDLHPPSGTSGERLATLVTAAGDSLTDVSGADHLLSLGTSAEAARLFIRVSSQERALLTQLLAKISAAVPGVEVRPWPVATSGPPRVRPLVAVHLNGHDLTQLSQWGSAVVARLRKEDGFHAAFIEGADRALSMEVKVDRERLAAFGIPASAVAETMAVATSGLVLPQSVVGQGRREIRVRLLQSLVAPDQEFLSKLKLTIQGGDAVPLTAVMTLTRQSSPGEIRRRNGERTVRLVAVPVDTGSIEPDRRRCAAVADDVRRQLKLADEFHVGVE